MATTYPTSHPAVASPGPRAPLTILDVPTETPKPGEVLVHVQWTSSSPAELHQSDGDIVTEHPFILGCTFVGTIVAEGPEDVAAVKPTSGNLRLGDRVCGFSQACFQTYLPVPRHSISLVPQNLSMEQAATVSVNLTTAVHAITSDLGLELPWPRPTDYAPTNAAAPILVWGAAGSVGNYAVQVLHVWGYRNILAVASRKHHAELRSLGASKTFDYHDENIVSQIRAESDRVSLILDCIGNVEGTLRPLSQIAGQGTTVATVVPTVIRHATTDTPPLLSMDPTSALDWNDGVHVKPIMTFFYAQNEFFKWHLQPDIIPALLETRDIRPNKYRIVEGGSLLERAQKALDLLRDRAPSGERLVWRVAD